MTGGLNAIRHEIIREGTGRVVLQNNIVSVHAIGSIYYANDNTTKKFWNTRDPGQAPFSYTAGVGSVIRGWDQGVLGMKLGEIRKIQMPAKDGYGESGFGAWSIPPNADLQFEIEVLSIS